MQIFTIYKNIQNNATYKNLFDFLKFSFLMNLGLIGRKVFQCCMDIFLQEIGMNFFLKRCSES